MTMQLGAIAFFVYCVLVCFILRRFGPAYSLLALPCFRSGLLSRSDPG